MIICDFTSAIAYAWTQACVWFSVDAQKMSTGRPHISGSVLQHRAANERGVLHSGRTRQVRTCRQRSSAGSVSAYFLDYLDPVDEQGVTPCS